MTSWFLSETPLLRARGGISRILNHVSDLVTSSPRTRRYFLEPLWMTPLARLFSAHAEVFP